MTRIYLIASNTILDSTTFRIIILANPIKKALKIDKNMRIAIIYKYIDTIYLMTNTFGIFAILTTISTTISEPPSSVQKDIILGFQYQYINLIGLSFQNGITTINSKFTITLEIEVKLTSNITIVSIDNNDFTATFSTSLNDAIFTIAINALQKRGTNETVAII
jgi:hypothetical protein